MNDERLGKRVANWQAVMPPSYDMVLRGRHVNLPRLNVARDGNGLYDALCDARYKENWDYLPYEFSNNKENFLNWLQTYEHQDDPCFFTICDKNSHQPLGLASYLRINLEHGVIEVGHIHFSQQIQRSMMASEAMFLMMQWAFEHGYRRYEWKCNALNLRSRKAAQRLGFSYEGIFRQAAVYKGRNRDTAWFSILDSEWDKLKPCFEDYLSDDNYDENGQQKNSLSSMTQSLLAKKDPILAC